MKFNIKTAAIIFGVLLVGNVLFLDFFLFKAQKEEAISSTSQKQDESGVNEYLPEAEEPLPTGIQQCTDVCEKEISDKVKEEVEKLRVTLVAGQSGTSPSPKSIPTQILLSQPKVLYAPLAGLGSTVLTDWDNIVPSEFYFDLNSYPGAKSVKFEVYLLALHGSAKVFARLYDQTNLRGVDNSELVTQSDLFVRLESPAITIWRGNNKYTVQLKSANGTEVQLRDAKLKIIY